MKLQCCRGRRNREQFNSRRRGSNVLRSGTMRCAYLAQDRVDIYEKIMSLAREMLKPQSWSHDAIETCGEVLKAVPRKAQQFPGREPSRSHLEVDVDSEWAGDTVTRRSTSGVIARR